MLLLVLLPLIILSVAREKAERELAEALERLKEAGHAVTLREVERRYAYPPTDKNAALLFERAVESLEISDEVQQTLPPWGLDAWPELGEPLPPEWAPIARQLVEENAEAIRLFQEAAQLPNVRYPGDYTKGMELLIPHVGGLRGGARFYSFLSAWQADQEDWEEAATSLETLFAIGWSLRKEPTLIGQLTRIAISSIGCHAVERALARRTPSEDFLARLHPVLVREGQDQFLLKTGLEGELAFGNHAFEMVRDDPRGIADLVDGGSEFGFLAHVMSWGYAFSGFLARDQILYLEIMKDYLEFAGEPLPARLENALSVDELDQRISEGSPAAIVTAMMTPSIFRVMESEGLALARARLALILIALERFRADHGALPASLEELGPQYLEELPTDPISGDPFSYRIEEEWAFVTSAGMIRDDPLELRLPTERR